MVIQNSSANNLFSYQDNNKNIKAFIGRCQYGHKYNYILQTSIKWTHSSHQIMHRKIANGPLLWLIVVIMNETLDEEKHVNLKVSTR